MFGRVKDIQFDPETGAALITEQLCSDDWIAKVREDLTDGGGPLTDREADAVVVAIRKHCPYVQKAE